MKNKTLIGAVMTILLSNTVIAQSLKESDCTLGADISAQAYNDAKNGVSIESRVESFFSGANTNLPTYKEALARVTKLVTNGHRMYQAAPKVGDKKVWKDVYTNCIKAAP